MTSEEAIKVLNSWNIELQVTPVSKFSVNKFFSVRVLSAYHSGLLRHAFYNSPDEAIHYAYDKLKNRTLVMIDIIEGES